MNSLYRTILKYYSQKKRSDLLASSEFGDTDRQYFLISYPKSGNTWIRMLLANFLKNGDEEISLKNVGDYVPDIYVRAQLDCVLNKNSVYYQLPYQFLKTHDPYLPIYRNKNIIYMVRDGRDTINSYYYYMNARRKYPITILDLIEGKDNIFIGKWTEHVIKWESRKCKRKIILKYEDFHTDIHNQIRRILDFLGWNLGEEKIQQAIRETSFENLRRLEEKYGWLNEMQTYKDRHVPFFRAGKIGDWQNTFSEADTAAFWKYHKKGMHKFEYSSG